MKVLDLNGLTKLITEMKSRFVSKSTFETDVKSCIESLGIKSGGGVYQFEVGEDGHLYVNSADVNSQYEIGSDGHLYVTI